MTIALMDLPYSENALEPAISAETLRLHYGKHHKAYVDKTNSLAAAAGLGGSDLEAIIRWAAAHNEVGLFNQSAQVWNHGFYWLSLSPDPIAPSGDLATMIENDFGSLDKLVEQIATAAVGHFASGWAWLMLDPNGRLAVETTHDAGCPVAGDRLPLLTIDVWEHAYYLDRKNDRKAYVDTVLAKLINWDFAAANLARGKIWTYPG